MGDSKKIEISKSTAHRRGLAGLYSANAWQGTILLVAPFIFQILDILVLDGQTVEKGVNTSTSIFTFLQQVLLVMESMKLETKIYAQEDGSVTLHCKKGDHVEKGALLVSIR